MDDLSASLTEQATCRICRSEATPEEPLFHPCRCSGTIRNVHQECLVEWLSHSQHKKCELCKTPFRFTKLYDAHMPENLPWKVFVRRAVFDVWSTSFSIARFTLVAWVWLIILPWIIRWAWRWAFWFADAGWAREEYLHGVNVESPITDSPARSALAHAARTQIWTQDVFEYLRDFSAQGNSSAQTTFGALGKILVAIGLETFANTTRFDDDVPWKQDSSSVFSSLSYLSSLTPYEPLNRIILDIFEGQLITCTVILSFILIFLIREWVVQQQPLINQDAAAQHEHVAVPVREQNPPVVHHVDDRYIAVAARIADLRADIEADIDQITTLQDRLQAQRQGIEDARRPGMPDRGVSSLSTQIRRELEESNGKLQRSDSTSAIDPKPITNAGADARSFIQWRWSATPIAVKPLADDDPAPLADVQLITDNQMEQRLQGDAADDDPVVVEVDENDNEIADVASATSATEDVEVIGTPSTDQVLAYTPDEELGDEFANEPAQHVRVPPRRSMFEKLADWFWDGIEANTTIDEQVIVIDEQRLGLIAHEAPFAPVDHHHDHEHDHADVDPEVAAAAQQAGLGELDLGDGGEEIEPLLELLGIRGPLIGMIQTSLFCLLLVASTVIAAVVIPYVWGKVVLSFLGSPAYFLVVLPLRTASFLADFVVDSTLLGGGWMLSMSASALAHVLASVGTSWPYVGSLNAYVARMSNAALTEANASGQRLQVMFAGSDPYSFNEGVLAASAHAHASLKNMAGEADALVNLVTTVLRESTHLATTRDLESIKTGFKMIMQWLPEVPDLAKELWSITWSTTRNVVSSLKAGNLALPTYSRPDAFDPALIYWNYTDRSIAVATGYLALAAIAAVYVASDISFTSSPAGRKIENAARDSLKQAGGVLKVILIISIEMLVFPFYCGLLLDFAFLPLFKDSTLASRLAFAASKPYIFGFVHWFLGTYYMFHFALFVGMCRKILRKGVLWFIRDPDDPDFHPVRDVLERNVTKQLRKIAFSALVYGALVILCLGGVIWSIGKLFSGIFPIVWRDTEPIVEFPLDLLLYSFVTPMVLAAAQPSKGLEAAYGWWLRRCARALRLSHFLFGQRMQDEEGFYVVPSWRSRIQMPILQVNDGGIKSSPTQDGPEVEFVRDGRYVLTPSHDQYRHPKRGELFLAKTTDDDVEIVDRDGNRHPHWSKVYLPPHFKIRVMLFMVCLWIFSAIAGMCLTLLPLGFGRRVLTRTFPDTTINDIYAYSLGMFVLGGTLLLVIQARKAWKATSAQHAAKTFSNTLQDLPSKVTQLAKCCYVYGYTSVVQSLLIAALIELYLFIPLHTFLAMKQQTTAVEAGTNSLAIGNATVEAISMKTWLVGLAAKDYTIVRHDIHLAQDVALAILLTELFQRFVVSRPTTRAAEAMRRATKDGLLNPDIWIATRYYILPTLIMSLFFLITPFIGSTITIAVLRGFGLELSPSTTTIVHRFAYAVFEALLMLTNEVLSWSSATLRWRARIRDEVYLVGERLHNFGEKRPPAGTKSVMRREVGAA